MLFLNEFGRSISCVSFQDSNNVYGMFKMYTKQLLVMNIYKRIL